MFLGRKNQGSHVVHTYGAACDLMRQMGIDLVDRQRGGRAGRSSIVHGKGLSWIFSGDDQGLIISRTVCAPDKWDMDAFISWMNRNNFVVAIYDPKENVFILATHVLLEGGVVIQNLARLVANFDIFINEFLDAMGIDESRLKPLTENPID